VDDRVSDATSLAHLLFGGDGDGDALLLHEGGRDHSLAEVRERAAAIARALTDLGVGPGTPVGVMLPNADVVATLFAVWRAGGVYVPLNPRLGESDLAHVVGTVEPAAIVTVGAEATRFGSLPMVLLDGGVATRPGPLGGRRFDAGVALVQLTSGTTGRPKPVLLEHAGVRELLDNVIATLRGSPSAKAPMPNLIPVSLSLWAGIYQVLFARLVGAPVVVMDGFDPQEFARLVDRFQIRSTVLPPAAMAMLSDEEAIASLAPLKYVRSITAPLSPLQARRFRDRFGLHVLNCYGQTEIGGEIIGWSAADAKEHGDDKLGAVGRPHAGVEVRTDEATGELQVRTPALSAGYADGSGLGDRLTPDGWFRTGDIGHLDDDGFVWIEGRRSEMINRGGLKVFPAEVEEVLRMSPDVADVAVVGVPDDRLGQVPWAFITTSPDVRRPDPDRQRSWEELCREHLAPYKVPVRFEEVDELPRNEVGKVLASSLAARGAMLDETSTPGGSR
jgi:long-chain acyl-CoA synthetase